MATASLNGSAKKADPRPMDVPFAKINMEYESTQMRPERDPEREEMFRELYAEGAEVDRVWIFDTPEGLLIVDGWTRTYGRIAAEYTDIPALIFPERTVEDALREAARANSKGTKPRCPTTIRNSVFTICDLDGADHSPAHYVRACGVNYRTAEKWRDRYREINKLGPLERSIGRDGKKYETSRNGNGKAHEPEVVERLDPSEVPTDQEVPFDAGDDIPTKVVRPPVPGNEAPRKEKKVDPEKAAKEKRNDEQRWLKSLKRDNGEPCVRDELPPDKREVFDRHALQYRAMFDTETHKTWARHASSVLGLKSGGKGASGPVALEVAKALLVEHPRDWTLCHACQGTGVKDGRKCPSCVDSCGFKVR
jgi:hypothetical protein